MENDKYYTPDKEDFFIGYEFEIFEDFDYYPEKSWHKYVYSPEEGSTDVENIQCPFAYPEWYGKIRTRFLTNEDIQLLGWVVYMSNLKGRVGFELSNYGLVWYEDGDICIILKDITKNEKASYYGNGTIYQGKCPSKNELKKLMKLLGI